MKKKNDCLKKLSGVILALSLALPLAACGSGSAPSDLPPDPPPDVLPELPPELEGQWKQVNSTDEGSFHGAIIDGDEIEIYAVSNNGDTRSLYWSGSFTPPDAAGEPYLWESQNNRDKTSQATLASQDDTISFTYADGQISYSASAMGTTSTIRLERVAWAPGLEIEESVPAGSGAPEGDTRPSGAGYDSTPFSIAGMEFSVPSYYEQQEPQSNETSIITDFEYYVNGDLPARLRFVEQTVSVTQEEFEEIKDALTESMINALGTAQLVESKEITLAGLSARHVSFTMINDLNAEVYGYMTFTYNLAEEKLLYVIICFAPEFDLLDDYAQMMETARLTASAGPDGASAPSSGIRPEFKETMDSYEEFINEYVDFINQYANAENPMDLYSDPEYENYRSKYVEKQEEIKQINIDTLSAEESSYYREVQSRVTQKLLSPAQ